MAIHAGLKDLSADHVREALAHLIQNFEADAAGSRKQIKDFLDSDQDLFYAAALRLLNAQGESHGTQYLVSLLTANGMLLRALCNPELSRDEAVALARSARRSDPQIEVAIARSLADSALGGCLARYEIAWQPVTAGASRLKVRVQTPIGWGETVINQGLGGTPEP